MMADVFAFKAVLSFHDSTPLFVFPASAAQVGAACGSVSASCNVTVRARAAEEYRINSITLRDSGGAELSAIPRDTFFATVSVTKLAESGDTMVCLAAYSAAGQYRGLFYASAESMPQGTTFRFVFPVDNSGGNIGTLKAFVIPSLGSMTPLGAAVSFQA